MYVIFETGGKQYKAAAGDILRVEKLPADEGGEVLFDKVLAVNDGNETHVGTPYLDAAVTATVTAVGKGDKVIVFKFKAKKGYRRKQGHRQPFTEIEIESVSLAGKTVMKKETPKEEEKIKADDDEAAEEATGAETEEVAEAADTDEAVTDDAETEDTDIADADTPEEEDGDAEDAKETDDDEAAKASGSKSDDDKKAKSAGAPKMTKADIMAKLDELGASYLKSAKKDELMAILEEAENK
jgi:large subunit ribosomal protein L21